MSASRPDAGGGRIHVHQLGDGPAPEWTFTGPFTIGRGEDCEVHVDSPLVSRVHVAVSFEEGGWWASDLRSTNGIYIGGNRVERAPLADGTVLQVGRGGPSFLISLRPEVAAGVVGAAPASGERDVSGSGNGLSFREAVPSATFATPEAAHASPSLTRVIERYFDAESDAPAGEHTRMIRSAYRRARKRDRRPWIWLGGALSFALIASLLVVGLQRRRIARLEAQAAEIFAALRTQEVQTANFRRLVERQGGTELDAQLSALEAERERLREAYDGYVEQLGVYRRLRDDEERLILRTARVFGESEFAVDAGFIRAVKSTIHDYWLAEGRGRFLGAVERAERSGYTPVIAGTLEELGLPLEFLYLALQESDLRPDRVGPLTRFGRAKGMWQFIPATAQRYGLETGPDPNGPGEGPLDDRLDFHRSTEAAARYLLDLYATLAQASGLLVAASYNWGEHRVGPRLEALATPRAEFEETFSDVPMNPESRNYWTFLSRYQDRMPEETKDYVLKIFAAAVIGRDPARFGLSIPDPLEPYRTGNPSVAPDATPTAATGRQEGT